MNMAGGGSELRRRSFAAQLCLNYSSEETAAGQESARHGLLRSPPAVDLTLSEAELWW